MIIFNHEKVDMEKVWYLTQLILDYGWNVKIWSYVFLLWLVSSTYEVFKDTVLK